MTFGVFIHRADSIYDDVPAEQYQFPRPYLRRAESFVGDWIIYYEPRKVIGTRGYYAVAKVERIVPDLDAPGMYLALIEPGSYLEFPHPVPFTGPDGIVEQGVLNDSGAISGRAQAAVRPISGGDFNRIVTLGLGDDGIVLPRMEEPSFGRLAEDHAQFEYEEKDRVRLLASRAMRERAFRQLVLLAYDSRCAVTGLKLINGGGRAEVEAAHIQSVEAKGPDSLRNGIALSGTAHWMFDRGLISLDDDLKILVSRHVNDVESVQLMINRTGYALAPGRSSDRPHPKFLKWHRVNRFKS